MDGRKLVKKLILTIIIIVLSIMNILLFRNDYLKQNKMNDDNKISEIVK